MRFLLFLIGFYCWLVGPVSGQSNDAWSLHHELPVLTNYVNLAEPIDDIEEILAQEDNSSLKSWIYAVGIEVDIRPGTVGQWDTIPGVGVVWRIGIRADHALSLNVLLENYRMQSGMSLYVYDETRTVTAGPFDVKNNKNGGVLPVQSIPGSTIIVEWNIPLRQAADDCFTIVSVGYGFRDAEGAGGIVPMAAAATCNIDINCKDGNHWQREKRSVVRMQTIYWNDKRQRVTQVCTGALINQNSKTKKPYLLTANHCISTSEMAAATTFAFGYEKPSCKAAIPELTQQIAGSIILATKKELDFTLLQLSDDVAAKYKPYYSGWNASPDAPANGTGIHHPQGDVKKISIDNSPLVSATFKDEAADLICDDNAHWKVTEWNSGITEKGSSGSPIFDPNHLIVGSLTGGNARCTNPKDDYYSKFCEQWNKYKDMKESLKTWLDPDNTGKTMLYGYDPVTPFDGRCDTLGHIGYNEAQLLIASDRWGVLTGHNNKGWSGFAEKFENDTVVNIIGLEANIARAYTKGSNVRFSIWTGNEYPVQEVYSKDTIVTKDYRKYPMHIYFDKTLQLTGNYFLGYNISYQQPIDTFALYQSAKRPYEGLSALYINDGSWRAMSDDVPPTYASLGIKAMGHFGKKQTESYQVPFHDLKVVFQPGTNVIFIYFDDPGENVTVECFDVAGKLMPLNEVNRYIVMQNDITYLQIEANIDNLPFGMYIIRARDNKKTLGGKFIRLY